MRKLLAISGGVDSSCLLHMFKDDPGVIVAHFNHGTRPSSDEDEEFVKNLAKKYNKRCIIGRANLGANVSEEKARNARYSFLKAAAAQNQAIIYTAHHLDDLVESIAINLSRGTGWRGLVPLDAGSIARSLVEKGYDKGKLFQYAAKNNLAFREDPTNHEDNYLRNRFRKELQNLPKENKQKLQKALGLAESENAFTLGIVSRLTKQKGIELIEQIMHELKERDIQLIVLGTGDTNYENTFLWYAKKHPDKFSANICFDNALAHQIYASCDAFLMPSLFEPCGLSQLISLKYGTLPIVRETGGLRDTITPYNEYTGEGNGFSFAPYSAHDLLFTIDYAHKIFNKKSSWQKIVRNAMRTDFSWDKSAEEYLELYKRLLS